MALVTAIAAQDPGALHGLYERLQGLVFTLALRITSSRETAEEVTVDVFHDVWRRAGEYNPQAGTVIAWVMNVARSRAIDRVRFDQRKKRAPESIVQTLTEEATPAQIAAPEAPDVVASEQRNGAVRAAVEALAPNERAAIKSTFFAERTHADAARQLGTPLGTLKTRVRSALAKLRRTLGSESDTP